ncbi:hypothetical protein CO2235_140019 [Cupriavidus oxalaticus]|uniref:Uncharacterized protein n=1 Tax=Cupriavidus oxalaticus TaxID=96344 RepID=A0A976B9Y6_9BURK|nr:hypothetical protein CO2235_140019 [Cupriavidus oxalaticus]
MRAGMALAGSFLARKDSPAMLYGLRDFRAPPFGAVSCQLVSTIFEGPVGPSIEEAADACSELQCACCFRWTLGNRSRG